ncbi:EMC3/TMCO1 family protein [Natrinema salsiterrestre]|uniref:EMC3/TMCO1 family protein n=1 Tax=Natrinema salsiterrestre TaxID=2950540 RepID=A0A9Q4L4V2_9EURY|nr:EMC3/TMCO1 family protein [Natrinema salsiterrestre]MDF9747624.1 EMC3/TMCO1 family protein [Natrinema salsiterrestre]
MTVSESRFVTDDERAAALATVLRAAEEGDGTVAWATVEGDISREHWGAMLARGVLVPAGDRFVLEDPTAVREALADREFDSPEPEGWSGRDAAAVVGACSLLAGYQVTAIRDAVAAALDVAVGPAVAVLPFPAVVFALAVATTVAATVVRRRSDPPETDGLRHRSRELRERLAAARARGDDAAADRLADRRRELVAGQALLLTDHLKVLARTMLLTVPVFLYLSWLVVAPVHAAMPLVTVTPILGDIVWTARVVGPVRAWMTWYALCSIASSLVVRRVVPDRFGTTAS